MKINTKGVTGTAVSQDKQVSQKLLWMNVDRVFYAGMIGPRSIRTMGANLMYVSLDLPIRISINGGEWQTTHLAVVEAYTPHRVDCDKGLVAVLYVEPETVDCANLPNFFKEGVTAQPDLTVVQRVRDAYAQMTCPANVAGMQTADFDTLFWGAPLPTRVFERRIGSVVGRIQQDPSGQASAADCAGCAGLSTSRFLHLFREDVGVSFRSFRTWKRVRILLCHIKKSTNLAYLAFNAGYPDVTHLSHSVRQVFGMTPAMLFKGCSKLLMYGHAVPTSTAT